MRHFVRVKDGSVIEGPKVVSTNPSESPNELWTKSQMRLHGIFEVDLTHDPISEFIDLNNPVINEEGVIYPVRTKALPEILTTCRRKKIRELKEIGVQIILAKYSVYELLFVALNVLGDIFSERVRSHVQSIVDSIKQGETEINNLTTRQSIEGYNHTFPSI